MSSPPKKAKTNPKPAEPAENGAADVEMGEDDNDEALLYEDEEGAYRVGDIYIPPPVKPYCSSESKGARLIITQIMNTNFKSYAGDVALGPFCHRFHSIIGPNGSGKSNVIDSMLFVFGYRANKIRCKKLSVLIHNSKKFSSIDSCRVAVHFALIEDKEDGSYEMEPDSEFIIAREAFRNNSSFYTINDRRVHFKEVASLLKKHNVDLDHNRFLILQGEVESIAMMKPKGHTENECGHLEYLEDIIGTTRYKEPLAKIAARVDLLTEERTEKHNRCKMAERELNDLKQPMEEAVAYLKLENEFTRTKNKQIQLYLCDANKKLNEYNQQNEEFAENLKEHDEQFAAITKERVEKENQIKEEIANHEKLMKEKEQMEQNKKKADSRYDEIQSTMTETNKRRKQIGNQLKKKEEDLEELKRLPTKKNKEIEECERKIEQSTLEKQKSEEKLQVNLSKLQVKTKPLTEKKEKLEAELEADQVQYNAAKSELEVAESELKLVQQNETTEKQKYESFKYSIDQSKKNLDDRQTTVNGLEKSIAEAKTEIIDCEEKLAEYKDKEKKLKVDVANLRGQLEEKKIAMQQARSNNRIVDFLMRKKIEGVLPGILGRLGDLGGIDAKYDVAVSTCCGRLDNIVVDTVETAEKCIEQLKKSNVGRATFIALEKVASVAREIHPIQTPENVPRLYDLIRVEDDRLHAVFYFSLRDTLVADNLDQATRIAYGKRRFRVVSLGGDVIELSGTMSGGGRVQFRGKMGTKVKTKTANLNTSLNQSTSEDLAQIQERAHEVQSEINYLQQMQGEKETRLNHLRQDLRKKEIEYKKLKTDVVTYAQQIPALEQQLEKQRKVMEETRSDPVRVAELEEIIKTRKKTFERCSANKKKITDQIDAIVEEIKTVTEEQVNSLQKSISTLTKQITKLNKHIMQLKVDIATSERNVKKAEESIVSMTEEVESCKADLLRMADEREQAEKHVQEVNNQLKELIKKIAETQTDSSGIKKEIAALQKQESDGKLKRIEIEQQIQNTLKAIRELKGKVPGYKNALIPLKLHNIPNEPPPEPLKTYTEEELATYKMQDIQYSVTVQEEALKAKTLNLNVIDEYQRKSDVYVERIKILEDITNKRNDMRKLFDDVKKRRYTEFMQGFNIITRKLKEMYQMITQGGNAELELVDSMDPFSEGIAFSVRPPRKSWKNISNLSGGEKTLSSLALVFALHYYKPSPLYFMDEIDAALDFKNVSIVANYIKDRTKNAQFIIISLRSNMFELADFLTGIYKVDDCTDSLTIENVPPKSISTVTQSQTIQTHQQANHHNILQRASQPNPIISHSEQPLTQAISEATSFMNSTQASTAIAPVAPSQPVTQPQSRSLSTPLTQPSPVKTVVANVVSNETASNEPEKMDATPNEVESDVEN